MLALELNDEVLLLAAPLAAGEMRVLAQAPGIASVQDDQTLTGTAAVARCKLQPQRSYQRYWQDLSATPLGRAHRPQLTSADLAYEQLRVLLQESSESGSQLIIAVPAGYSREQLGLLLGIATEAGVTETGLVDAALAACALTPVTPHVLHLELYRHRAIVTHVEQESGGARRARFEIDNGCGMQRLEQLCIESIAGVFVRSTRFDPLHQAQTEQLMADGVRQWLSALGNEDQVLVTLASEQQDLQIEWSRAQWLAVAEPVYAAIVQLVQAARPAGLPIELRIGEHAQLLPGLVQRLQSLNSCAVTLLPTGAAARGALQYQAQILRGNSPSLICQLPLPYSSIAATGDGLRPDRKAGSVATHVLCRGRAFALREQPLVVGTQVPVDQRAVQVPAGLPGVSRVHCRLLLRDGAAILEDLSTYGCYVNDERVHGSAVLQRGDRLRLGAPGIVLDMIELVTDHATPPV
jgi:hypothetical protein